jgi:hypothetical protein
MDIQKPHYWDEWVEGNAGDLKLKPGAPRSVQTAFDRLLRQLEDAHRDPGADSRSDVPCD